MNEKVLTAAKVLYDFHHQERPTNHADFILTMGSHDLRPAEHAAKLFLQGKADFIVAAGGFGKITRDLWQIPEAEKYAEIMQAAGVPADKIFIENESTNSGQNFQFMKRLLASKQITVRSGLIVSKTYLGRRAMATAQRQWPEVDWYIDSPAMPFEQYPTNDVPLERMIALMVGDTQRLLTYPDQGFQVPVTMPDQVLRAYEYLIAQGYTTYLQ
ncbi:YdcF family protein [Weissella cibaria]|uniref:YdcF family protein n=1 Tax=Weissella cibaria TaxID=137591 RepID=UPI00223BE165|nr:YdcF family protein [Weissella cibaria]MCT0021057.1 YdcF family protein [Weissella cibaria]